jgi:hypothetical protein
VRITWFVLFAYAAWFGASLLTQDHTPRIRRLVQRLDPLRLCPTWHLFRSPPLHAALVWRDQLNDHTCTAWRAVSMVPRSTWLAPLWRPQAYQPHLLYTLVVAAVGAAQAASGAPELESSFAYRALWHYIVHLPQGPETIARQFQLLVSDDSASTPPRVVYCSALRPVPGPRGPASTRIVPV